MNRASRLILVVSISLLVFLPSAFAGDLLKGWSGDIFLGYNKTSGNTNKASGSVTASALKKFDAADFLLKGNMFYSESNKVMDGQKWDGLAKYSFDFGKDNNWFNFYQVMVDHDRFSDIHYRVTPGLGLGYHISKTENWTWDVDGGLGYRITRHGTNKDADDEALTAIAHTFAKKKILENAFLSEDATIYPGLKSDSGYLLRSETAFTNRLTAALDLEVKYILDYNSEPAVGKKKSDSQIVTGIKYKF